MPKAKLSRDELLSLLNVFVKQEEEHISAFQMQLRIFWAVIPAIGAATLVGIVNASRPVHYLALVVGPGFLIILCRLAKTATNRHYLRFLEAIAQRAKVETALGMTADGILDGYPELWAGEPLVAYRHIASRRSYKSSAEFVELESRKGLNRISRNLALAGEVIAWLGMGLLVVAAVTA